jgi:hypothetical protein
MNEMKKTDLSLVIIADGEKTYTLPDFIVDWLKETKNDTVCVPSLEMRFLCSSGDERVSNWAVSSPRNVEALYVCLANDFISEPLYINQK